MRTSFSRDLTDPDKPIREAAKARGGPVRLRVQPMIYAANGQYTSWKTVVWTLECDSATEALATRDALQAFFTTMTRCGPKLVTAALRAMQPRPATLPAQPPVAPPAASRALEADADADADADATTPEPAPRQSAQTTP